MNINYVRLALSMAFTVAAISCGETQVTYKSKTDFVAAQKLEGYVLLGNFGNSWPARIIEEKSSMNEISFNLSSGAPQRYPSYTGYELKMVRLIANNDKETVIVLRSKQKGLVGN